jgi:hypothetical protein
MSSTATIDGTPMDVPDVNDLEAAGTALGGVSTYTCDADTLTLTPTAEGGEALTQTFSRR